MYFTLRNRSGRVAVAGARLAALVGGGVAARVRGPCGVDFAGVGGVGLSARVSGGRNVHVLTPGTGTVGVV